MLTHSPDFVAEGCQVVHSIDEALAAAADRLDAAGGEEALIIGGGVVFQETVSLWERLYIDAGGTVISRPMPFSRSLPFSRSAGG